ncbi:MAG TPA: hypothetical protein VMM79_14305 [Longimicrobiales bacterium]|nr:hypothetical protein [Longimicrobiales bacterium]
MSFDPESVDWTDPVNYFRCRNCGEDNQAHIAVGPHDWLACPDCGIASPWGYNLTSVGKNQTDEDRAAALVELSKYRVAPEHENAMVEGTRSVEKMGGLIAHLLDDPDFRRQLGLDDRPEPEG